MKTRIVYKVTTNSNKSILVDNAVRIQYKKGEWVKPKIAHSLIFCFEEKERAMEWANCNEFERFRVWKAIGKNPQNIPSLLTFAGNTARAMREVWEQEEEGLVPPFGTIGATQLKLIEEIIPEL